MTRNGNRQGTGREPRSKRCLVLGLGNTILSDDGIGVLAARKARELLVDGEEIDVKEAEIAGFALLDLLEGYRRAVVIDAVRLDGLSPGEIALLPMDRFEPTSHLTMGHQIDLPTAARLGAEMGSLFPEEVVIVGVQVADDLTVSEACTPEVAGAIEPARG